MSFASLDTHQLAALGGDLERAAAEVGVKASAIVRKTAYDIEGDAKNRAPVDTGFLRSSISTTITGRATITAEIGPTAEYGIYQELGTSRMPAQPYLAPAFDRRLPAFETAMAQIGGTIL